MHRENKHFECFVYSLMSLTVEGGACTFSFDLKELSGKVLVFVCYGRDDNCMIDTHTQ